ncbi:MAG: aldo/keto reductase [candidate division Zixibacteria bacterium]|nr:aldo/keto reductase [candidate division Zixibacteria bacterium]MDH3938712.1 aldo/keto reductase [candidate division Zixibacteria bacterium]
MVSRIGLASGYGVPAAAIEKAFHEYGVNYFYVSPMLNLSNMVEATRNLSASHRDELCIVLARPYLGGFGGLRLESFVERWLKKLKLDWVDLLLQDLRPPLSQRLTDRVDRLRDNGKVRFVGMSSHKRPLFGRVASGEAKAPADFFHVRYNAVHTGAEHDVFPHLPREDRPGIVIFTATCWRKLLKPKLMPAGHHPLTAADCYRFVLSHPDVNVCVTGPSTAAQMEDNLKVLNAGPLNDEDMDRVRRIGKHIYGKE